LDDRYAGRPFLRLLDSFFLWSIGALDDDTTSKLEGLTPKFRQTFGMELGTWQDVVMAQMDFDDEYVEWAREKWRRQLDHDQQVSQEHNPLAWAQAMSDFVTADDVPSMS
jgi:hypothetical protein